MTFSRSFLIIKPAVIANKEYGRVLDFLIKNNVSLDYMVRKKFPKDIWLKLYEQQKDTYARYDEMCESLSKSSVIFVSVTCIGDNAHLTLKKLRGHHVDPEQCEPNTIRYIFGKGLSDTVVHVPDEINYHKEYVLLQNKEPYQRSTR